MSVKNCSENNVSRSDEQIQAVSRLFAVLGEPTRLLILQTLQEGPATVSQIMLRLELGQANASRQLSILHQAGILSRQKQGTQVIYAIRMPLVTDLCKLVCGGLAQQAASIAQALSQN